MKRSYDVPQIDIREYLQNESLSAISTPDLDNTDNWIEVPLG